MAREPTRGREPRGTPLGAAGVSAGGPGWARRRPDCLAGSFPTVDSMAPVSSVSLTTIYLLDRTG